jgi:hypothetical protein
MRPCTPPPNVVLAESDHADLVAIYKDALLRGPLGLVQQFEALIRAAGRVGINCHPSGLVGFLEEGVYKNLHQLVSAGKVVPGADYGFRLFVERALGYGECGQKIIYGSLNIGNGGCRFYGDYCVVLQTNAVRDRVSFLRHNAFSYITRTALGAAVQAGVPPGSRSTWESVPMLAVAKLQEVLASLRGYNVPALQEAVAGYSDCLEAHIYGPVERSQVEEIRVPLALIVRILYLRGRVWKTPPLPPEDELFLRTHNTVLDTIERYNLRLVPVP